MIPKLCFISIALLKFTCVVHGNHGRFGEKFHPGRILEDAATLGNEVDCFGKKIKLFQSVLREAEELDELFGMLEGASEEPVDMMLMRLCAKEATPEDQANAIATFVTKLLVQEIKNTTHLAPHEKHLTTPYSESQYVCVTKGKGSGMKNVKFTGMHEETNITDGSMDFNITYEFKGLNAHYDLFYLHTWPFSPTTGKVDVDFAKSEIELRLTVPDVETVIDKVIREECIITLKNITILKLNYKSCRITDENNEEFSVATKLSDNFLNLNSGLMTEKFSSVGLEEVLRALRSYEKFVCKDNITLHHRLQTDFTEDFTRFCGSKEVEQKHE